MGTFPGGCNVTRGGIHILVLSLLATVGAGYVVSLRWPWGAPGPLGGFGIAALAVGAVGLGLFGWAGAVQRRGGHVPPWSLLLAPALCVILAGLAEMRGVPAVLREYEGLLDSWSFHSRWFWLADGLLPARVEVIVGLLVAGLGFAGAAVSLGRAEPAGAQRWRPPWAPASASPWRRGSTPAWWHSTASRTSSVGSQ